MSEIVTADVVVIGLGAMGSAALLQLAARGVRAIGIDRYEPPHAFGSSHGESRITRLAVGEGDAYAPLVRRSHAIWRDLEAESGETLLLQNGGLILGVPDSGTLHHGKTSFVERTIGVARASGISHEVLDAGGIARRFPQFGLTGAEIGYFEAEAGMLFPERCIEVQLRLARARGAVVRIGETVRAVSQSANSVQVVTDRGCIHSERVVVAAGPWLASLTGAATSAIAKAYRQSLHWFAVDDPAAYAPERFPVFIWIHGQGDTGFLYGFPTAPGGAGMKVATETYVTAIDPDAIDRVVQPAESAALYAAHVAGRLHGVTSHVLRTAACMYTVTPDAGFLVDTLPHADRILCVSACSGHGFKHSAGLGEVIAERLTGSTPDLSAFAFTRYADVTASPTGP